MGSLKVTVSVMQFLIFSSLLVAAHAQLVAYPNGAVAPFDPNNAAATKEHFAALAEAGSIVNPYTTHAQDLAVPVVVPAAGLYYGKRSVDPQVAIATAQHYAAKAAYGSYVPLAGAANVHPPAALVYGRKKREADPQLLVGAYPYYHPYAYAPVAVAPFVAHPNGAVVPLEPEDVVRARADHLAAVAEALKA